MVLGAVTTASIIWAPSTSVYIYNNCDLGIELAGASTLSVCQATCESAGAISNCVAAIHSQTASSCKLCFAGTKWTSRLTGDAIIYRPVKANTPLIHIGSTDPRTEGFYHNTNCRNFPLGPATSNGACKIPDLSFGAERINGVQHHFYEQRYESWMVNDTSSNSTGLNGIGGISAACLGGGDWFTSARIRHLMTASTRWLSGLFQFDSQTPPRAWYFFISQEKLELPDGTVLEADTSVEYHEYAMWYKAADAEVSFFRDGVLVKKIASSSPDVHADAQYEPGVMSIYQSTHATNHHYRVEKVFVGDAPPVASSVALPVVSETQSADVSVAWQPPIELTLAHAYRWSMTWRNPATAASSPVVWSQPASYTGGCLSGHDDIISDGNLVGLSLNSCQAACLNTARCQSIDWSPASHSVCRLAFTTADALGASASWLTEPQCQYWQRNDLGITIDALTGVVSGHVAPETYRSAMASGQTITVSGEAHAHSVSAVLAFSEFGLCVQATTATVLRKWCDFRNV